MDPPCRAMANPRARRPPKGAVAWKEVTEVGARARDRARDRVRARQRWYVAGLLFIISAAAVLARAFCQRPEPGKWILHNGTAEAPQPEMAGRDSVQTEVRVCLRLRVGRRIQGK